MMRWHKSTAIAITLGFGAIGTGPTLAADLGVTPMAVKATPPPGAPSSWAVSFQSEVRWFSWENTRGYPTSIAPLSGNGKGTQLYMPMSLSVTGNPDSDWKLEFNLRGGYVSSNQATSGEHGSVSTPTDTQASGTVTYNGFNGFQPFVAMLVNMPTGKSALFGSSRFARMDGDLVSIATYGEGWNLGPSVGVNVPITQALMLTLSSGYTFRGKYKKEAASDPVSGLTNDVKNGDEVTVSASLGYFQGAFSALGSVSYSWDGVSQVDQPGMTDFAKYRSGPRLMITGFASYDWTDQWSTSVNGFWMHSQKNDVLDGSNNLIPESLNSNSDMFQVGSELTYKMTNGLAVGPVAGILYRNKNAWSPTSGSFVPPKTRWSAGAKATYNVTDKANISARVEHVWIHENEVPAAGALYVPTMNGQAWQISLGGTAHF